jgi:prephenate dehydratase
MAKVRKVDYFVVHARNRAGEGARMLKALKKHDVSLLALSAFPEGGGAQVDFIPEDTAEFLSAAKALNWKVSPRKIGFLVQGRDKTGALAGLLNKLGKAGVNVTAIDGISAGKKRFGAIFWVLPGDVAKTAKLLGAK